jgi:hypothetical protein
MIAALSAPLFFINKDRLPTMRPDAFVILLSRKSPGSDIFVLRELAVKPQQRQSTPLPDPTSYVTTMFGDARVDPLLQRAPGG